MTTECGKLFWNSLIAATVAMLASTAAAADPLYTVTDLGTPFGINSTGRAISDSGQVVGWSGNDRWQYGDGTTGLAHAFVWAGGVMQDKTPLAGDSANGFYGVNSNGYAVGWSGELGVYNSPILMNPDGSTVRFPVNAPGVNNGQLYDISDSGYIAWAGPGVGSFRTRLDGSVESLPQNDFSDTRVYAINERGHITGHFTPGLPTFVGSYVWVENDPLMVSGVYTKHLKGLGSVEQATGINDNYQAVIDLFGYGASIWNYRTDTVSDLPGLVSAYGINNRDEVVGIGINGHATVYRDGTAFDLNSQLTSPTNLVLEDAHAINDKGWIAGTGTLPNGDQRAFLAIPTAQPGLILNQDFNRGDLVGWSPKGGGIADAVSLGAGDFAAKLLTALPDPYLGQQAILDQYLDTFAGHNSLDFAYQFRTTSGVLTVSLDGHVLATLNASGSLTGAFQTLHFDLSDPLFANRTDILLDFNFDGAIGSEVWLDNVALTGVPEPSTLALSCTATSSAVPTSTLVSPTAPSRSSRLATRGRRRSPSTSSTLRPACARATARLAEVTVLPSPGTALVITRLRGCCLEVEELQVGPQQPERLGARREGPEVGQQRTLLDPAVEADARQHRRAADLLDVLEAADRAVEDVAGDGEADAQHQPDQPRDDEVEHRARGDRALLVVGGVSDPRDDLGARRAGRRLDLGEVVGEVLRQGRVDLLRDGRVAVGHRELDLRGAGDHLGVDLVGQRRHPQVEPELGDHAVEQAPAGREVGVGLHPRRDGVRRGVVVGRVAHVGGDEDRRARLILLGRGERVAPRSRRRR